MDKIKLNRMVSIGDIGFAGSYAFFVFLFVSDQLQIFQIDSLEAIFIFSYNILGIADLLSRVHIFLLWFFPLLYVLYRFGTVVSNDLNHRGSMIFTRTTQRNRWFVNLSVNIWIAILVFYGIQYLLMICMGLIVGYASTAISFLIIFSQFILTTLFAYSLALLMNILSLSLDSIYSLFIVIFVNIGSILLTFFLLNLQSFSRYWIIKLFPTTQSMIIFHTDDWLPQLYMLGYFGKFPVVSSFLYLIILILILNVLGIKKIKTMDIL